MTGLLFFSSALVIVLAGTNLSRYGDVIAARSGLSRTWIGLVLTATITSLPELVTGLSAVVMHEAPEVAVGDVTGSLVFNLLLLVLVDLLRPAVAQGPDFASGHRTLLAAGALGMAIVAAGLHLGSRLPAAGRLGLPSLALVLLYALTLRRVGGLSHADGPAAASPALTLRKAAALYSANALLVVAAAGALPRLAVDLAHRTGLGQSFVGSALVGATTSLPELAVTVSAVRMGALDLAVAGLLGSNLFDLVILAVDDAAYGGGPLLEAVGRSQLAPVLAGLLMSLVLALAWRRPSAKPRRLPPSSLILLALYAGQLAALYAFRPR